MSQWQHLGPGVYRFADGVNSYLICAGDGSAVVIDPGLGGWWPHLEAIGVERVAAIFLTHLHRDQFCGLYRSTELARQFRGDLFVPAGDVDLTTTSGLEAFWHTYQAGGCPRSYAAPCRPLCRPACALAADSEHVVGDIRLCVIATPGHSRDALSYLLRRGTRQYVFCGDAAHAGATLHQLHHLEWDHWTPEGALQAWYGLERLRGNRIDLLLPAHGAPVRRQPRPMLARLQERLLRFVAAKTAIAPGQPSRWIDAAPCSHGALRILPHLYAFGANGYLLAGEDGHALVVDPQRADLPALAALLLETGLRPQVATASHYHTDHTDGLNDLRQRYGTRIWLHPWVADPLRDRNRRDLPWLPAVSITPDRRLPETGRFRWGPYAFDIRPYPGQTWWHCAFDTVVDGRRVLFSGDNFQPPSRWNGTGGFCAFNGSRFDEGFARAARAGIQIDADIVCNGHRCVYSFDSGHYGAILSWCDQARVAVADLCPRRDRFAGYGLRSARFDPFILEARPGQRRQLRIVLDNPTRRQVSARIGVVGFDDIAPGPGRRRLMLPPRSTRRATFDLQISPHLSPGRYPVAADVTIGGDLQREACVALVDLAGTPRR